MFDPFLQNSEIVDGLSAAAAFGIGVLFSGEVLGLLALATFVGAPAQTYYPVSTALKIGVLPTPHEIASIIGRAWAPARVAPLAVH